MTAPPRLILASTSIYRRELLSRLRLPFDVERPGTDETALPDEAPEALASRLARAKASDVAMRHAGAWVIGSDQVAECGGRTLGKPGDHAAAVAQLASMSGQAVRFHTGLCLARDGQPPLEAMDCTVVRFRALDAAEIERYLRAEQPYDCAGSFKSEGLGIGLFESIENRDPTALIGLPLIATARLLREAGLRLP